MSEISANVYSTALWWLYKSQLFSQRPLKWLTNVTDDIELTPIMSQGARLISTSALLYMQQVVYTVSLWNTNDIAKVTVKVWWCWVKTTCTQKHVTTYFWRTNQWKNSCLSVWNLKKCTSTTFSLYTVSDYSSEIKNTPSCILQKKIYNKICSFYKNKKNSNHICSVVKTASKTLLTQQFIHCH